VTERFLTPSDIAEQCQLSTKTVLRAIRSGRLRAYRLGTRGGYRVDAEDLEAWIAASRLEPESHAVSLPARLSVAGQAPSARGQLVVRPGMGRNGEIRPHRSVSQEP
jgi:excisionase family DNA binding protein